MYSLTRSSTPSPPEEGPKSSQKAVAIGVGLGVGLGVPLLMATSIIGAIYVLKRKTRRDEKRGGQGKEGEKGTRKIEQMEMKEDVMNVTIESAKSSKVEEMVRTSNDRSKTGTQRGTQRMMGVPLEQVTNVHIKKLLGNGS